MQLVALAAIGALVVTAYFQTLSSLAALWSTDNYRHGYAVPLISAWLLWNQRARLSSCEWRGSLLGVLALAASVWGWIIASTVAVQSLEHVAVYAIFVSCVLSITGRRAFSRMAFPLFFVALAIPVGDVLVPYLMESTANLTAGSLRLFGIPVFRDEMILVLPGGTFEVAEVCSGYKYLNAGVALGLLVAYWNFETLTRRATFMAFVGSVFVLANGLRVFLTVAIASATDMQYMVGMQHVWFGWLLFLLAMVFIFWVSAVFGSTTRTAQK